MNVDQNECIVLNTLYMSIRSSSRSTYSDAYLKLKGKSIMKLKLLVTSVFLLFTTVTGAIACDQVDYINRTNEVDIR